MVKNIVFDMGMVLVSFDWKKYLLNLNFEKEINDKLIEEVFANLQVWNEHDRGILSDEEFIRFASEKSPEIMEPLKLYMQGIGTIIREYDYSRKWMHSLKERGYRVYILSNYGNTPYQYAKEHFSFLKEADGIVISSHVKMIKPEEGIYRYLLDTYRLNPEETVFLDDREDNINAARNLGIHGIVFQNYEQGKKELEDLLVFFR